MPDDRQAGALLVLMRRTEQLGLLTAQALSAAGSPEALLNQRAAGPDQQELFAGAAAHSDQLDRALENAEAEIVHLRAAGISLISALDPDYPSGLRELTGAPGALFSLGVPVSSHPPAVAVIGARSASEAELGRARDVATQLVAAGWSIASGLAAGIDTAAHAAALDADGRTIAVLGTGILRSYPPQNAGLQRKIGQRGTLLSQFLPDAAPSKESFPQRNAVMSGLSVANVVIAASSRSGARLQARLGLAQGRPALFDERLSTQAWVTSMLEHEHASTFASPDDLARQLTQITRLAA